MRALHFGAGNIGRGFIGKLLADAHIDVTFADINQQIIDLLVSQQQYQVHIVGEKNSIETVHQVNAINSDGPQAIELIAQVDLITTAVGPQILIKIAKTFARGIIKRCDMHNDSPLNIIACENMVRGTSQLKQQVINILPKKYHSWVEQYVGFVDSAVDRIIPPALSTCSHSLDVTVESFSEWIVDRSQFKGQIPTIKGMELTDNLMAFIERKLFTLNTGHAISAYLGQQAGLSTIRDAILSPPIRDIVKGAMMESGAVLIKRYHFDAKQHAIYIKKIISRFENPYLHDEVDRVGRQPLRKLSHGDRLIKPLLGTLEYNLPHQNLITGIAAALSYRNAADPQALELENSLANNGIKQTIETTTGLTKYPLLIDEITKAYLQIQNDLNFLKK